MCYYHSGSAQVYLARDCLLCEYALCGMLQSLAAAGAAATAG